MADASRDTWGVAFQRAREGRGHPVSGVFISYRREDTSYIAGRLHDRLAEVLSERIFRDIDDMRPGIDFVEAIDEAVGSCDALVAVIGEHWLSAQDPSGNRRIDAPNDWVRLEIAAALNRDILVVPVLVENATVPTDSELPADIRRLARRNAMVLTDERWDYDVQQLVHVLDQALKGADVPADDPEVACAGSSEQMPLPALLSRTDVLPMVGRGPQLSRLAAAGDEVAAGARRAVFVAGEPGAGKTRLAAEAATRAHRGGALVLAGRCDDGMAVPYQPFLEALRHFVDRSCDCHLLPRLGRWPGELSRLVPELGTRVPALPAPLSAEPETEQYRLFDAVASWLAAASAERPVLLVLDDLQWSTKPTLLLLRHVLRSRDSMRLLVLATYRDTEVPGDHPLAELLTDLRHDVGVARLPLEGLDVGDVRELVVAATSGRLSSAPDWAAAIHADTEGNPFFVAEMARYIVESDALDGASPAQSSVLHLGIPEGVQDLVGRRLSRLAKTTSTALAAAAVMGLEFEPAVVERASRLDEETLLCALEEATGARLVEEVAGASTSYRFSHALVRASVYDRTTRARRAVLHRRVGEAMESIHGGDLADLLPVLAQHFAKAADGGVDAKAAAYARRAGDQALAQLANDEAVTHYRGALASMDPGATEGPSATEYCEVLISLGEAEARAGDPRYRQTLLDAADRARRLGDSERLARAALSISRGRYSGVGEVDRERVRILQAALEASPAEDGRLRALLLAYQGVELVWSGNWDTRVALSDEAVAMARRLDDPATLALVLHLRFMTLWAASTLGERLAIAAEAQALASRLDDPTLAFHAAYSGCHAAMETGDMESADRLLASARELSQQLHQPLLEWRVLYTRGLRAAVAGDFAEGERLAAESLALGQNAGQPDAARAFTAQIFTLRFHQGRLHEVVGMAESGLVPSTDTGSLPYLSQMCLAVVYCQMERRDGARRVFDSVMADGLRDVPNDYGWLATVAMGAEVCSYLKDARSGERLHELLEPYKDQCICIGPTWLGSTAHYLALMAAVIGEPREADRHFATAADAHAKASTPVWQAHTQLAWGEVLLDSDDSRDPERGHRLLEEALRTASRLGMASIERRARTAAGHA